MTKQILIAFMFAGNLWASASQARPMATVTLVGSVSEGVFYELLFQGTKATLSKKAVVACDYGPECKPPKIIRQHEMALRLLDDHIASDGPKRIDLGQGYVLEMVYEWVERPVTKKFRLLLPNKGRTESLSFVNLHVDFDIEEANKQ